MPFPDPERFGTILLDIEGTTTPKTFVYDVLFPYATKKLRRFVHEHFQDAEIRACLDKCKEQRLADANPDLPKWREDSERDSIDSLIVYLRWLMERDSKLTALKALQGKIWEEGYALGELSGQVYPDVPPALRRWSAHRKETYIYSSGSELAQRLLFRTTEHGDLTNFIAGFFDTRVGAKTDPRSYREIACQIGWSPKQILFLSDSENELQASQLAGMSAVLAVRSLERAPVSTKFQAIGSFDEIL